MDTQKPKKSAVTMNRTILAGVREYEEEDDVLIKPQQGGSRLCVYAFVQRGTVATAVDLMDLLAWIKKNKPELIEQA